MRAVEQTVSPNFFVVGGTMRHDAPSYVERAADKELLSALLRDEFCHVLTSRQMGKSSLMLRTASALRSHGVGTAILDLTAIGQNVDAEQWYGGLLIQLGDRLGMEDHLLEFWQSQTHFGPMQRWVRGIRNIVVPEYPGRLVIFIDEIDAVRSLNFPADEFFAGIRECYNLRNEDRGIQRLTFCLLGVASPSDLIRDTRTTPFNVGHRIELNDFTVSEAEALAVGLHGNPAQCQAVLKRILYWTNGHPYLTQRICASVAGDTILRTARDVDRVVDGLFFSKRAREYDDNLIFVRERLLRSGAELPALLNFYSKIRHGKPVIDDDANPLVSILRLSGITHSENGKLRVRNPIYNRVFDNAWILSNLPDAELRRQREAFKRGVWRTAWISTLIVAVIVTLALVALWQRDRAVNQSTINSRLLYAAQMKLANQEFQNANIANVETLVDQTRSRPGEEDLRGFEWFLFWKYAHSDIFRLQIKSYVANLRFVADSRLIAIAEAPHSMIQQSREYTIKLYDRIENKEISTFSTPAGRNFDLATFSPDLKYVATDTSDYSINLWDLKSGQKNRAFWGLQSTITAIAFSPRSDLLASVALHGTFKVWEVSTGREKFGSTVESEKPSIAFSPDDKLFAITSNNTTVQLFAIESGKPVKSFSINEGQLSLTFFSADGTQVLAASMSGRLYAWDLRTGKEIQYEQRHSSEILSYAFSPDTRTLATGSVDRTVMLWDVLTGKSIRPIKGHGGWISSIDWSNDGNLLLTGDNVGAIRIWDVGTKPVPVLPDEPLTSCAATGFTAAESLIALCSGIKAQAKIWNLSTGTELSDLMIDGKRITAAAFSSDTKTAAVGMDKVVKLWDVESGKLLRILTGHDNSIFCLNFSPDGKRLISGDANGSLILWDIAGGSEVGRLDSGNSYYRAVFSPDGRTIATADQDGTIRLWDAESVKIIRTLSGHTGTVKIIAFSPDGRLIASGADDNTVRIWDSASGKAFGVLLKSDSVVRFAFSPDGKRLVTGSIDGSIKLWDVAAKEEIITLRNGGGEASSITFSKSGSTLAVSAKNGKVVVWQAGNLSSVQ